MEFLSRAVLLPLAQALPDAASRVGRLQIGRFDEIDLIALLIGAVCAVVAYWIAANIVAPPEQATFKRALQIWGLTLLVTLVIVILGGIAIPIAVATGHRTAVSTLLIGAGLLAVGLMFSLPMHVLGVSFWRALGFWPIAMILILAAQTGRDRALGRVPRASWQAAGALLRGDVAGARGASLSAQLDLLAQPAQRRKTIPERQAALRGIFEQLQELQRTLPPDNAASVVAYEQQRLRYEDLLRVLRADYAAQAVR